ncbi:MAG: histidinol dehydrogenase, partial [Bacteroidota bacterium]
MLSIISAADWVRPATEAGTTALADARGILDDIRANGTAAIRAHSLRLDGFEPASVDLKPFESYDLDRETTDAIRLAHARIRRFAEMQRETVQDREFADETGRYGQRVVPVRSVAAYVPGGRHPLVSTALMTLVPAEVAGVETRVAVSPSTHPAVLAACSLAGAT